MSRGHYDRDMTILREKVIYSRQNRHRTGISALMPTEQENAKRALRALCKRIGGARKAALAMGMSHGAVAHAAGKRPVSAEMALRIARAARVPVSDVLRGVWPPRCWACGRA